MFGFTYNSPLGEIKLESDGQCLTGLWFNGSIDSTKHKALQTKNCGVFLQTCKWLDIYFAGKEPNFTPKYKINNLTKFRKQVLDIVAKIPYGKTISYGDIAKQIAKENGIEKMSAQAVGGAAGWNPICLIIPCHRVVGNNGNLTGYGGGIENKVKLLKLEHCNMKNFSMPKQKDHEE